MVASVAGLDFIRFSSVSDYLASHESAGTVRFSQDTADGSFNGYHSWAEKAYTSDYWTRIERNRRMHRVARQLLAADGVPGMSPDLADLLHGSFETRLRALSTTNFGLATPFLTRSREAAMQALLDRLDWYSDHIQTALVERAKTLIAWHGSPNMLDGPGAAVETFVYLAAATGGDRHLTFRLDDQIPPADQFSIADAGGRVIPALVEKMGSSARGEIHVCESVRFQAGADAGWCLHALSTADPEQNLAITRKSGPCRCP